jgi:dCMP deaminase
MGWEKERLSWDEMYMFMALIAASRSSCNHLHTGAIIVNGDKRIVAEGYNGAPKGTKNCLEMGCRKEKKGISFEQKRSGACKGVHAEVNAIHQVTGERLSNAKIYTVFYPCSDCAKEIVAIGGIKEVVYIHQYSEPDSLTKEIFKESGIKIRKLNPNLRKCLNAIKSTVNQRKN